MTTTASPAFYTVNNPLEPDALDATAIRAADYRFWKRQAANHDPEMDCDGLASSLTRITGKPRRYNHNCLNALLTLVELPRLQALQEELFHLDLHRLQAIDRALAPADRALLPDVDALLTEYLTPTKPNQHLPGHKAIVAKINTILTMLDDSILPEDETPDCPEETYHLQFHDDGGAELNVRLNPADAAAVDARVRALAAAEKITLTQALVQLLMGEDGVKIILNLYQAMDVPDAPVFLHKANWLDDATGKQWAARARLVRNIDEMAEAGTSAYRTPETMRAYMEGRDGICRCPDCDTSAVDSEMDHRINHADGGATTPGNLASLCRRDHNLKTSNVVFYLMEEHTGDIVWLHADGSWTYSEPEGPLSRKSRLWIQTLAARREERNGRARQEARHRKRLRDQANNIPEEDTPPPF